MYKPKSLAQFRNAETHQLTTFNHVTKVKTIAVRRGEKVTIGEVQGKGYITQLWMTFPGWFWQHWSPESPISQTILKTLILRIYWDGETIAAVQAPVGDFFGNGLCEISNFASLYFGMSSGGFFCKFPMPFKKGFRIEVENLDPVIDTDVFCNVIYQLTDDEPSDEGYFHAQFHTGKNPGAEPFTILDAEGRGHYVGCTLSMQGEPHTYLAFLEAPEYVYVDDMTKPRIIGTGLEDYFLGGWYFREGTFIGPFHGVPSRDTLNSSVAMYRIHEGDSINFKERIRFQFINPRSQDRLKTFAFSSVAFYYSDRPGEKKDLIPGVEDLLCWYRIKNTDRLSMP